MQQNNKTIQKWLFDDITRENIITNEDKPNWQQFPDHSYSILIIIGSRSGRQNALLNLIIKQPQSCS